MSDVVVFVGPSLRADEVHGVLPGADIRPPVEQGDVLRVALERRCRVIAIVDGYFERVPAVWHKEILWAMDRGIHVFGAASMGALRAAELHAFGMEGIGAIFEAFRDGDLEADDEVAVLHGPAELGYRAASEALVNVRATAGAAFVEGVVSEALRDRVVAAAKSLFYPERNYPAILARAGSAEELAAFARFVETSRVDQKRLDALAMLREVSARLSAGFAPKRVAFAFQRTSYFELLHAEVLQRADGKRDADGVVDEVLLNPELGVRVDALAHRLAVGQRDAEERGVRFDDERALLAAADTFRRERDLVESASFAEYLRRESITDADVPRLLSGFAASRWHAEALRSRVVARYPDALRLLGLHRTVTDRAARKASALEARGLRDASLRDAGVEEAALLAWYFGKRLGRPVPADLDAYAKSAGFADGDALVRAVLAEHLFVA